MKELQKINYLLRSTRAYPIESNLEIDGYQLTYEASYPSQVYPTLACKEKRAAHCALISVSHVDHEYYAYGGP